MTFFSAASPIRNNRFVIVFDATMTFDFHTPGQLMSVDIAPAAECAVIVLFSSYHFPKENDPETEQ